MKNDCFINPRLALPSVLINNFFAKSFTAKPFLIETNSVSNFQYLIISKLQKNSKEINAHSKATYTSSEEVISGHRKTVTGIKEMLANTKELHPSIQILVADNKEIITYSLVMNNNIKESFIYSPATRTYDQTSHANTHALHTDSRNNTIIQSNIKSRHSLQSYLTLVQSILTVKHLTLTAKHLTATVKHLVLTVVTMCSDSHAIHINSGAIMPDSRATHINSHEITNNNKEIKISIGELR